MVEDSLRVGINYITNRVNSDVEVYVIDVGRDAIHEEPMIISTWPSEDTGSFVESIFEPEYLAKSYSPDENIRVAYDGSSDFRSRVYRGSWDDVDFFDVVEDDRLRFREEKRESYRPDTEVLDVFYELLRQDG